MKKFFLLVIFSLSLQASFASMILIPMDLKQADHLKAYGIAYWVLTQGVKVDWMLNYRGGSFAIPYFSEAENECVVRNVTYEIVPDAQYNTILTEIADPEVNEDIVKLEKAPKIAVYSPKNKRPWDDAVTLVLTYAEIPYDVVYDDEVLEGKLSLYDWLHLHHEDFTGQYGKFYAAFAGTDWYRKQVAENEAVAKKLGYSKVSELKKAVARTIKAYVAAGGFLFAMCSATDTFDIALAAEGVDIVDAPYDGDSPDPGAQRRLDFSKTLAFRDFTLDQNPYNYRYSDIDVKNDAVL